MLFVMYWELSENMSQEAQLQAAQKVMSTGIYEDVNIIRWDITPDGWGITIFEADSAADIMRTMDMWRTAGTGLFKCTKTSPAMPIQESMTLTGEVVKALASA
jgi:hypothetical protein